MSNRIATSLILVGLLLLVPACGVNPSDAFGVNGNAVTVTAITTPFVAASSSPFTITGANFATAAGPDVTIRFTATTGTPFLGGTSATADVPGTVVNATTISGDSPVAATPMGTFTAFVTVILPTTVEGTSATDIATFIGITVTSMNPPTVQSDIPVPYTLSGDGFGPTGSACTVTFSALSGTPFAGGTAASISVPATVDSATQISGLATPIAGAVGDIPSSVTVTLVDGSMGASGGAIVTFLAPRATAVAPTLVDQATPTLLTITGAGFAPAAGSANVTFEAPAGTPFAGGTASSLTVSGTIVNATTITCVSPIAGLANKLTAPIRITNTASGATGVSATGLLLFEVAPDAVDDPSYTAIGNVGISVLAAAGVLVNDSDPDMDTITVTAFDATSANGGDVSVAADGSFTYNPPAGFEGADTFTYTISDGFLTDTANVTVTVSDVVWFVDENATMVGDGRFGTPFDTLAAFNAGAADEAGDYIYLYGSATSYAGNITLLANQQLIGQGVDLVVQTQTLVAAGATPTLAASTGDAVTLAADNTVRGLAITNSSGDGIVGTTVGSPTVDTVSVNATGGSALDINGGTSPSFTFSTLTSTNAPADGIRLSGVGGSLSVTGATTLSNPTGDGIDLGSLTSVDLDFAGMTITTPGGDGILLDNVSGSLDVSGNVTVTTPTDDGVDIRNSAATVTFADVDVTNADNNGIELLSNGGAFTLDEGLIDNPDDIGISATTCTGGITLGTATTSVVVQESGDAAVAFQKSHAVLLDDCTGSIRIENSTFDDVNEHDAGGGDDNNGVQIEMDDGGTCPSVQIIDCTFRGTEVAGLGTTTDHGVRIVLDNASQITDVDVTGGLCGGLGRSFVQVLLDVDDDGDLCRITDLNISNNGSVLAPLESQADVVEVRCDGSSVLTLFHIDGNIMRGGTLSSGNGVRVNTGEFALGATSTASATGTINGNDIDDLGDGTLDNGIEIQVQEATTMVVQIDNNTVDGQFGRGIRGRVFDDGTGDVTISNNSVGVTTANGVGIEVQTRSQITNLTLCLDLRNNDVGSETYDLLHDAGTFDILNIGAGAGGTYTPAQVDTFIQGLNTGTSAAGGATGVFTECTTIQTP